MHVGMSILPREWWQAFAAMVTPSHAFNVSARAGGFAGCYVTGPGGHTLAEWQA